MEIVNIILNNKTYYSIKFEYKKLPTFEITRTFDGKQWNIENVTNYTMFNFNGDTVMSISTKDCCNSRLFVGPLMLKCLDRSKWYPSFEMFIDDKKNKFLKITHELIGESRKEEIYIDCSTMKPCGKPHVLKYIERTGGLYNTA